ncbi:MAG TPA: phage major capsid protein [Verrucomicrobiae bacterium]|nr:phage major capsid protein [Verrucomicrobiae bacterium]
MTEYTPEQIDNLTSAITKLAEAKDRAYAEGRTPDAKTVEGTKAVADDLAKASQEQDEANRKAVKAQIDEQVKAALVELRSPSMAAAIGMGKADVKATRNLQLVIDAHPFLAKAYGSDYVAGDLIRSIGLMRSSDAEEQAFGKATLRALGVQRGDVPTGSSSYTMFDVVEAPGGVGGAETIKATLGATGATGGFVLPNNLVDTLAKPKTMAAIYTDLVTVRNGVNVRGVDQPFRTGAPARAQFQDWGQTKENVNEAYGSYTANLGTIARVYDIGKQYLRFSQGSAEEDVLDELGKAFRLGENFYIIAGAGTGSVGSGDPTTGVYTALNARPGFKTAFGSASVTTVAGSFASACATAMQNMAGNNRAPTAIVVDHITYFTSIREGADAAGFWVNPAGGPTGFQVLPNGQLHYWGVPVFWDSNLGTNATTKILIAAQWDAFKLYRGMEFRVDSSDQAGTRWDTNLVGYRGEEEIGFHAGTGVETGAAFLVTAVIP